jgi:putative ABC transport system permease protein
MSYSVAQRAHEMGIRMALGARGVNIIRMIVRQGAVLAAIGVLVGMAGSVVLGNFMSSLLFNTKAVDPVTFLATAALLFLVAMVACFVPAYRAASLDPANVLREG